VGALETYAGVVRQSLVQLVGLLEGIRKPDVETVLIENAARDEFIVKRVGWHDRRRVNATAVYVRIKGGKIWIEEDGTEPGIATAFLEAGIPKEDIVLGFQPPERRHLTEFAIA
jgi:hypothetical protein